MSDWSYFRRVLLVASLALLAFALWGAWDSTEPAGEYTPQTAPPGAIEFTP